MSNSTALITLGILTFLAPFSGLPYSVLNILLPLFGIAVFAIGFSMRAKRVKEMATTAAAPAVTPETTSNIG